MVKVGRGDVKKKQIQRVKARSGEIVGFIGVVLALAWPPDKIRDL